MDWLNSHSIFLIGHIIGVAFGAGAAFVGDIIFINSVKDKHLSQSENRLLDLIGTVVWLGLGILVLSGLGLVWQRPDIFLNSGKFWAKMTIVLIIALNGLFFHFAHRPVFKKSVGSEFSNEHTIIKRRKWLMVSGAISVTSWMYVIILGTLKATPFSYFQFIGFYLALLSIGIPLAISISKYIISAKTK